eukprot:8315155-Alexandrium_andersonii.AAC.1
MSASLVGSEMCIRDRSVISSPRPEPEHSFKFLPRRPRPGVSAPCCALTPMAMAKQAGVRASGAFR